MESRAFQSERPSAEGGSSCYVEFPSAFATFYQTVGYFPVGARPNDSTHLETYSDHSKPLSPVLETLFF